MKFGGVFTFLGALTSSSSILLFILLRKGKELAFKRKKQELGVNQEVKLLESKENVPFDRSTTEKEELV